MFPYSHSVLAGCGYLCIISDMRECRQAGKYICFSSCCCGAVSFSISLCDSQSSGQFEME